MALIGTPENLKQTLYYTYLISSRFGRLFCSALQDDKCHLENHSFDTAGIKGFDDFLVLINEFTWVYAIHHQKVQVWEFHRPSTKGREDALLGPS